MSVLLLRLAGSMQSWGTQSRFTERDTGFEPSKSGVVGLLCAAMGIPRGDEDAITELGNLEMGIRVDREGKLGRDYHTTGGGSWPGQERYGVVRADGSSGDTVVSNRYYLAGASFLVAFGGPTPLLERIHRALKDPVWPLFLGRKSFVPGEPVRIGDGMREGSPEQVLRAYPWRGPRGSGQPGRLRLVLECPPGSGQRRLDRPVRFTHGSRLYRVRYVRTDWVDADGLPEPKEGLQCISRA